MRKSLLVPALLLIVAGCGEDPIGPEIPPERTVQATLIIDYDDWDAEGEERRRVTVRVETRSGEEIRCFGDLPQEGPVEISMMLPCQGHVDYLAHSIWVTAFGIEVSEWAKVDDLACTEEPQVVHFYPYLPGGIGPLFVAEGQQLIDIS